MFEEVKVTPKHKAPRKHGNPFQYSWDFLRNTVADNKFQTRINAVTNGGKIIAQTVAASLFFVSASPVIMPFGLAACALFAGVSLGGIGLGAPKAWMSLEGIFERTFPKLNPLKHVRLFMKEKIAPRPFVQKIAKHPFFKKHRLSPRQQDTFLAGITIGGALTAMIFCGLGLASFVAAAPVITAASFLRVSMAFTVFVLATGPFDVFCGAKTLLQTFRSSQKEKREQRRARRAGKRAATAVAPPAQGPKAAPAFPGATKAFNNAEVSNPDRIAPSSSRNYQTITIA